MGEKQYEKLSVKETQNSTRNEVLDKLNTNRINPLCIQNDNVEVLHMDPERLINNRRFDIMAKYIYGKFHMNNWDSNWGYNLYEEHMWIFNNYDEDDGSGKKGKKAFINSFNQILDSIKKNGFHTHISLIPIGENEVPFDGAHRLAAGLLYNEKVKTVKVAGEEPCYNYEFFKKRGLLTKWSDAMAYEYCKIKKNTFTLCYFSRIFDKNNEIRNVIEEYGAVYYEKEISFNSEGLRSFLIQIIDSKINYDKIQNDHDDKTKQLKVIILELDKLDKFADLKTALNILFKEKNFFYLSNNYSQTTYVTQLLLNENSVHFLNNRTIKEYDEFEKNLAMHKTKLKGEDINLDSICFIGNTVLDAYGISQTKKAKKNFKYICFKENIHNKRELIDSDGDPVYFKKTIEDILFNPDNHFYHAGLKFASLPMVKEMKKKQGIFINQKDIKNINQLLEKKLDKKLIKYKCRKKLKVIKLQLIAIKFKYRNKFKIPI